MRFFTLSRLCVGVTLLFATRLQAQVAAQTIDVAGIPRGYATLSIPLSLFHPTGDSLSYDVRTLEPFSLIGSPHRTVSTSSATASSVFITLSLPASAPSGLHPAALVHANHDSVLIRVNVAVAHKISLSAPRPLIPASPGALVRVPFIIQNLGNAVDTIPLRFSLPAGWILKSPATLPSTYLLAAHSQDSLVLVLAVPANTNSAQSQVHLSLAPSRPPIPEAFVNIQVFNSTQSQGVGPQLAMGAVLSGQSFASNLSLVGKLTPDLNIHARYSQAHLTSYAASRLFSLVNFAPGPPYLSLDSPHWSTSIGLNSFALTPLTGQTVTSSGESATFRSAEWNAGLLNGSGGFGEQGDYFAAGYLSHIVGNNTWQGTFANLTANGVLPHSLFAMSIQDNLTATDNLTLTNEVAVRHSGLIGGLGASSAAQYHTTSTLAGARLSYAPAGSQGFAPALHDALLFGSRDMGHISLGFNTYLSDDANSIFSHLSTRGASLTPTWHVFKTTDLRMSLGQNHYSATIPLGIFSTTDSRLDMNLSTTQGPWTASIGGQSGQSIRQTLLPDRASLLYSRVPQASVRAYTSYRGPRADVNLNFNLQKIDDGSGTATTQTFTALNLDRVKLPHDIDLSASAQHQSSPYAYAHWSSLQALLSAHVSGLTISMGSIYSTQFNSPVAGTQRPGRFQMVLKVRRPFALPLYIDTRSIHGRVYVDKNNNHEFDGGDVPLPNVIVLQGFTSTRTSSDGTYRLGTPQAGPVHIDPRSLPAGLMSLSQVRDLRTTKQDLVVVPTSTLRVTIHSVASKEGRLLTNLSALIVQAIDQTGQNWVSQSESDSVLVFSALPPGKYTLDIDASALSEPARLADSNTIVTVPSIPQALTASISITPRPLRVLYQGTQPTSKPDSTRTPRLSPPTPKKP